MLIQGYNTGMSGMTIHMFRLMCVINKTSISYDQHQAIGNINIVSGLLPLPIPIKNKKRSSETEVEAEDASGFHLLLFASQLRSSCDVLKAKDENKFLHKSNTLCGMCEQAEGDIDDTDTDTDLSINSISDDSSIIGIYQKMMINRLASMNNANLASEQSRSMLCKFNHKRAKIDNVQYYNYNGLNEQQLRTTNAEEETIYYTIMLNHVVRHQKIINQRMQIMSLLGKKK